MNYYKLKKQVAKGEWQIHQSGDNEASISIVNRVIAVLHRRDVPQQNMTHAKLATHCVNKYDKALNALKSVRDSDKESERQPLRVAYLEELITELETVEE